MSNYFVPVEQFKRTKGPLYIHNKRWYFHLISKNKPKRSRALLDDYRLCDINNHLIVCYTPAFLPGQTRPFLNQKGQNGRIYASFTSYIEFFHYSKLFSDNDKNFYEIVFGEFTQKPHFDLDIDKDVCMLKYPNSDYIAIGNQLKDAIITACCEIIPTLNISKDVLIYSSHGKSKQSYHIVINNYYHYNNLEAKAFYEEVCRHIIDYTEFIDGSVYSPRQQFRILGSQKTHSNRQKLFCQNFRYLGKVYEHQYVEEIDNADFFALTILSESLLSFTPNCSYIPSLLKENPHFNYHRPLIDLDEEFIYNCLIMLQNKMDELGYQCPFTFIENQGTLILLRREAPSYCPICDKDFPHENENSYMYITNNMLFWDCRRSGTLPKLFVGYVNLPNDDIVDETIEHHDTNKLAMPQLVKNTKTTEMKITEAQQNWLNSKRKEKNIDCNKPVFNTLNLKWAPGL